MHKIRPGKRAHWVKYENINSLDFDGMSLASFCQSRAVWFYIVLVLQENCKFVNQTLHYCSMNQLYIISYHTLSFHVTIHSYQDPPPPHDVSQMCHTMYIFTCIHVQMYIVTLFYPFDKYSSCMHVVLQSAT